MPSFELNRILPREFIGFIPRCVKILCLEADNGQYFTKMNPFHLILALADCQHYV